VLTALFGLLAALAPSFGLLCGALLLLGSAVGVRLRRTPAPRARR
jgi:hypothetical protein